MQGGFRGSSAGKESACNAGDPSSIPESGRSPVEGIGYPHLYSWASLVARMVKNLPAMWKTWVQSLGWEDSLEEGMATHSSILAWQATQSIRSQRVRTEQLSAVQHWKSTKDTGISITPPLRESTVNIQVLFLSIFSLCRKKHNFYLRTHFYFCKIEIKH